MSAELALAAVAGVAAHLGYFIRGEFHVRALKVTRFYLLFFPLVFLLQWRVLHQPLQDAFLATLSLAAVHAGALFASMLVYRSCFHRLHKFPGPPLAKLSKFYHAWKVRDCQACYWLHDIHQKYGDFVRTGPSEITIFTPDAIPHVLGPQSKCSKSPWWEMMWPEAGIATTRDVKMHDSRRRAWDKGFSIAALRAQEPHLSAYVDQLVTLIASKGEQPVDFTQIFTLFAFDVMGDLNFGSKFNMMKNGEMDDWLVTFKSGAFLFGPFTPLPWAFLIAARFPGMQKDWLSYKAWSNDRLNERLAAKLEKKDILSYAIEHADSNSVLGDEDRSNWLLSDFMTLFLAASEPVVSTSVYLIYHLVADPSQMVKLRKELATIDDVTDQQQLQRLTHLNALIDETLRLHPSVPAGGLRETPPEGITVGSTYIPGNTTVLIPHYSLGRREDCYEEPLKFIPERWTTRPKMVKNRDAFIPFQTGNHLCLGMNLAKMEVRLAVARIVSRFDLSFAPGETGRDIDMKMLDLFTATPGPLRLVFKERDVMA